MKYQTIFYIEDHFAFAIEQELDDTYENRILALKEMLLKLGLDTDLDYPEDISRDQNQFKYQVTVVYQICKTMKELPDIPKTMKDIVEQYLGKENYRYVEDYSEVVSFDREKQTRIMLPEVSENTVAWNSRVNLKTYLDKVFIYIPFQFYDAVKDRTVAYVINSIQPNLQYIEN